MSTEQNKAVVRRYYEEGPQDLNLFDELLAPTYVLRFPGSPESISGIENAKQLMTVYLTGFPDLHNTVEDVVAEGDKVATRITVRGTHKGPFQGIPPTGKQVTTTVTSITRLADGKIVQEWVDFDALGMLQQLGVIPPMG